MLLFGGASIKSKLLWIIMVTSASAVILGCAAFAVFEISELRRVMAEDLRTVAEITADNVSPSLSFADAQDAAKILAALRAKPQIVHATVFDNAGNPFAVFPPQAPPGPPPGPEAAWRTPQYTDRFLSVYLPVQSGGERVGSLHMRADLREQDARLRRYPAIIATVVLLSLGVALIVSSRLQRIISRPITHLAQTARQVSSDKNYSVRAERTTEDEIGNFIDSFNEMLSQIQQRDAKLQRARDDLERRVEERTRELQEEVLARKKSEEAARASEIRFRSLVESATDAIILATGDGRIALWNHGAAQIFGYTEDEAGGQPLAMIMPEPFRAAHAAGMRRFRETGEARVIGKTVELQGLRKNGEVFPLDLSLSTWRIGEEMFYSGIIRDITERKQSFEKLRHLAARLQQSNHELQAFAYVASHDLQEPLRKVQAFGDRLKAVCHSALTEEGRDYLGRMMNAASRMQTLINDLLLFSRVSTQAQPFRVAPLGPLAHEVLADLEVRVQQTNGRVEIGALPALEADPVQMRQLFQNLISNALKFHQPGVPPVVKVWQCDGASSGPGEEPIPEGCCRFCVEDNGIGFDEKYRDKIFGVFQRLHSRSQYEGTGIGLAICRKIVERHDGSITARSAPGKGAAFFITLPLQQRKQNHEI